MHLCIVCQAMQPILHQTAAESDVPAASLTVHQASLGDVILSMEAKCYVCTKLFAELEEKEFETSLANRPLTWCVARTTVGVRDGDGDSGGSMMENASLEFWIKGRDEEGEFATFLTKFVVVGVSSGQLRGMTTSLQPRSTKALALRLAEKWLKTCGSDHSACRSNSSPKWYPTRLLELHPQTRDPVLIYPSKHSINGSYACLSHCWGTVLIPRLCLSNHTSFQSGIPYTLLPATFQQTIDFCLALGLRYLWIDSLCIIQDSVSDWRAESAIMDDVYRNAVLCLSASGAKNATEGLYFDRDIDAIGPLPQCPNFQNLDWRSQCKHVRAEHTWHIYHSSLGGDLFSHTRTVHRCWIFQERMLSARILHFARDQIFWECGTTISCETFPSGFPQDLLATTRYLPKAMYERTHTGRGLQNVRHKRLVGIGKMGIKEQMGMTWGALVTEYSRGVVSWEGDRLVALGGMARSFWGDWKDEINIDGAGSSQIRYVAGLWSLHLPQDLLWKTTCTGPRPSQYRAPTWSWASIDGRIEFDLEHWKHAYVCTSTVLNLHVEYVESPWGEVRAGYLCVKGPVRKLNWVQNRFKTPFAWPQWGGEGHGVKEIDGCRVEILPDERPDVRTECWGDILYGLLVLRINDSDVECRCVVILDAVNGAEGVFRRVGVVKPMSGGYVARWFDGVEESIVKIV